MTPGPVVAAGTTAGHGLAVAMMIGGMAAITIVDTISKVLTESFDPIQVTWARYFFHALPMLVIAGPSRSLRMARTTRPFLQVARSGLFLVSALLAIVGFSLMPLADLIAIGFAAPLMVVALSVILLGETVGLHRWTAVLVGFGGVLVIVWPSGEGTTLIGGAVAFTAAVFWALGLILTRKIEGDGPWTTLFYTAVVGAVVLSAMTIAVWRWPDPAQWGLMLAMGIAGMAAHTLIINAFMKAPASIVAPFQYSQLLFATAAGWIVFGDPLGTRTLTGAAIIISAGLYVWHRERMVRARQGRGTGA